MELIEVNRLKPIEGFSKKRAIAIKAKIMKEGIWTKPICIERTHFLVLDGMHRLQIARMMALKFIPCLLFDYKNVEVWSLRKNHIVSRELVIEKALKQDIYPYKTVKHKFPVDALKCEFKLTTLKGQ